MNHYRDAGRTAKDVLCVLGPTNTGKTHYAIERMLTHPTGMIGLPLRLLAREVYQKVVARVGVQAVALVTGEEKIKPPSAHYWIATVEAMPRDVEVAFLAVDEVQLSADLERGHVFTDRILNRRGACETLFIGSGTMAPILRALVPDAPQIERPRLSKLTYAGRRNIARLPPRSAIVAFSSEEVYAIAEWIRRQKGGTAVVLGALSPRTRNAQIDMFQAGEVDYVVATDAIGMGLNLDVEWVAFASDVKFDGRMRRRLRLAEIGQIAGRAGRNLTDGYFVSTGRCADFSQSEVEALENHAFEPESILQWRNPELDFSSPYALLRELQRIPSLNGLTRSTAGADVRALETLVQNPDILRQAATYADVERLWDACQIPDYRKTSPSAHIEIVTKIFFSIVRRGVIAQDWFAEEVAGVDRIDGDIDTLSQRISRARTFAFLANRGDWLNDNAHWQERMRQVEDRLSDALHERLAQRFVDRRTSLLLRRLRENAMLEAEITAQGDLLVEGQHVGQIHGFRFTPDPNAEGEAAKTLIAAAQTALGLELEQRAVRVHDAVDAAFALSNDGAIRWLGEPVAKIAAGDKLLQPIARLIADERLTGEALEKVQRRLDLWLAQHVTKLLGALAAFESGEGLEGLARGVAWRIFEDLGVVDRAAVSQDVRALTQEARASLRKLGLRFGAYHIYAPALLKPAPRALATQLWALKHGGIDQAKGLEEVAQYASSGRTSFPADADAPQEVYRVAGFKRCGDRAVRVDILERLADLIRPAVAYRPGVTPGAPPAGAADGAGFVVTQQMTSLAGASGEAFGAILRSLGFVSEMRQGPAITVALAPAAPIEPIRPVEEPAPTPLFEPGACEPISSETAQGVAEQNSQNSQTMTGDAGSSQTSATEGLASEAPSSGSAAKEMSSAEPGDTRLEAPKLAAMEMEVSASKAQAELPADNPMAHDGPIRAASEPPAEATLEEASPSDPESAPRPDPQDSVVAETAPPAESIATEPKMIEVWTPQRQNRPQRPHRQAYRHDDNKKRHDDNKKRFSRAPAADGANPIPSGAVADPSDASREARADNQKFYRRSDGPRSVGHKNGEGDGEPRKGEVGKFAGRKSEGRKFAVRNDHTRNENQNNKPRDKKPDPNSPFAQLAALKAELEKKK